jgi:hypothetical protein
MNLIGSLDYVKVETESSPSKEQLLKGIKDAIEEVKLI